MRYFHPGFWQAKRSVHWVVSQAKEGDGTANSGSIAFLKNYDRLGLFPLKTFMTECLQTIASFIRKGFASSPCED